jgi:hypothetical protein
VLSKPLGTTAGIIVGLAFVWITVGIAIVALRIGKWGPEHRDVPEGRRGRHLHDPVHHVPDPARAPGWSVPGRRPETLPEALVAGTAITLLWPGAIKAVFGQSYSVQASWGVSRVFFEWATLGAFGAMVLLGIVFWAIGARNLRRGLPGITTDGGEQPQSSYCAAGGGSCPRERFWCLDSSTWASATSKVTE